MIKWNRKSDWGSFKPYVSEDGRFVVADMSFYRPAWFKENGKRGYWWALIERNNGEETIIACNLKTAKEAKAVAESK